MEFAVLGSDGLWDVLSNDEVAKYVAQMRDRPARDIARGLIQIAYERGSADNISAIVVDLRKYIDYVKSRNYFKSYLQLSPLKFASRQTS